MTASTGPSLKLFAARTLTDQLGTLQGRVQGVRAGDVEAVHQMRVASRRLRAALKAFADALPDKPAGRWRQETKRVTKTLGKARDLDVQIQWLDGVIEQTTAKRRLTGLRRLRLRLWQQRQAQQPKLLRAMDRLAEAELTRSMPEHLHRIIVAGRRAGGRVDDPAIQPVAAAQIEQGLEEMLAYDGIALQPHLGEQLHQLRIAAKRLRYTMEVFQPLYDDALDKPIKHVKKIQAALGDLHDMDVWIDWLPTFVEQERQRTREFFGHLRGFKRLSEGLEHLREHCIGERECAYERFVHLWRTRASKGTWEKLRRTLADPPSPTPAAAPDESASQTDEASDASPAEPVEPLASEPRPDDASASNDRSPRPEIRVTAAPHASTGPTRGSIDGADRK